MKAHHHSNAARVKIYQGRRHTKKYTSDLVAGKPLATKNTKKKASKTIRTVRPGAWHQCYWFSEKPTCSKNSCFIKNGFVAAPHLIKGSKKFACSKVSSFGGDLEGAFGGPQP